MKKYIIPGLVGMAMAMWSCQNGSPKSGVEKEVVIESCSTWNHTPLPAYPQGTPQVTLVRIVVPPHSKLDWHKHPVINVGYMTKGSLTVTADDGSTLTLQSGDGIVELVNQYHYGENKSDHEAEIIVFYAGEKGSVLSEKRPQ